MIAYLFYSSFYFSIIHIWYGLNLKLNLLISVSLFIRPIAVYSFWWLNPTSDKSVLSYPGALIMEFPIFLLSSPSFYYYEVLLEK